MGLGGIQESGGRADRVLSALSAIFAEHFELEQERLTPAARLGDDLELDSLDGVTLEVELQDRLGVDFEEADYREIQTFGDLTALLRERVSALEARTPGDGND